MRGALPIAACLAIVAFATTSHAEGWVLEANGARVLANEGSAASEKAGSESGPIKKPASGKRDEVVLQGGSAMLRDLAPLLGDAIGKDCPRNVSANLVAIGGDGNEIVRMTFGWAIVTEVDFPALDGGAGPASDLTLKLEPQFPKRGYQKGVVAKPAAGPEWKKSGFRLAVDGLDLKSVKQLGELRVSQALAPGAPITCAAPVVSDLVFAMPTGDAGALATWRDAKNGTVDYVAADGSTLLKVKLSGLKLKSKAAEGSFTKVVASVESAGFARK